jgi:hypothetical protein
MFLEINKDLQEKFLQVLFFYVALAGRALLLLARKSNQNALILCTFI